LSPGDFRTKNFHHCTIQRLKGAIPRKKPAHTNAYGNSDSHADSDINAYADANTNPMYGEVFTDTEASAYSSAPTVVVRRADLSAVASAKAGE